ncbi:MAG: GMC family oxidoreductase [Saprospiraceae bacterium]|nr:GMC family oxidoreductase [Saprospiraceae bacterium]
MANLNTEVKNNNTYDAIVIGSGMSGGWAAKELCEKGLKTLVLERGREVKHGDYPTAMTDPWDHELRGSMSPEEQPLYEKQRRSGFVGDLNKHHYVNDQDHPYHEEKRFDWIRGYQTGGRSLIWGRHCYRWSDLDFEANAKEGVGVDWPVRYKEIASWYSYVEKYVGIAGEKMGLSHLPDGEYLKPFELNCLETHTREVLKTKFNRHLTIGRVAHLTEPINGRGQCQNRDRCDRGCPFGAYFSSNAVTLPAAAQTGNLTLRPHSIVSEIMYDADKKKATGVRIIDANTNEVVEYYAKIIFCNASTMGTAHILLNSKSDRFPNGLGNDSGEVGHNIMDHHYFAGAYGTYDGMEDKFYHLRRPTGFYIPKFRNIDEASHTPEIVRGFGYQGGAYRTGWDRGTVSGDFGGSFKDNMTKPGPWEMMMNGFGEILPDHNNHVKLHPTLKDKWGLPQLSFHTEFTAKDLKTREYMQSDAAEMLEAAGLKNIKTFDSIGGMGKGVHEMGTARMGNDPKTSVLNKWNQMHNVNNLFITDGAFMASAACVNPSITYMAFTARAVDYAVNELNKQNL